MENPSRPCAACGLEGAPLRCPCKGASFCGKACQKALWEEHRKICTVDLSRKLEEKRKQLGDDHRDVGQASMHIGLMFQQHGNLKAAERNVLEAVRIFRIYGAKEEDMLAPALSHLGTLYIIQGKYAEARVMVKKALEIQLRIRNGNEGVEVAYLFNSFDHIMQIQGNYAQAAEEFGKALTILRGISGSVNEPVAEMAEVVGADILASLGCLFRLDNMPEKAMENYSEALRIQRIRLASGSTLITATLMRIATLHIEQERFDEAASNLEEALPYLRCHHGEKSLPVAKAMWMLAIIYREQGHFETSLKVHRKVLRYRLKALGVDHEDVAESKTHIALILMEKFGKFDEALDLFQEAELIQNLALGADHETVERTQGDIAICLQKMGDVCADREIELALGRY